MVKESKQSATVVRKSTDVMPKQRLPMKSGNKVPQPAKLQIPLGQEQLDRLDSLKSELGFQTRRELFDNAIWTLNALAERVKQGGTIIIEYPDNRKVELTSPYLDYLRSRAALA